MHRVPIRPKNPKSAENHVNFPPPRCESSFFWKQQLKNFWLWSLQQYSNRTKFSRNSWWDCIILFSKLTLQGSYKSFRQPLNLKHHTLLRNNRQKYFSFRSLRYSPHSPTSLKNTISFGFLRSPFSFFGNQSLVFFHHCLNPKLNTLFGKKCIENHWFR